MGCISSKNPKDLDTIRPSVLKKPKRDTIVENRLTESDERKVKPSVHFMGDLGLPASSKHRKLRILHFNDCYNIEENPKKQYPGGAARFVSAINHYQEKARSEGLTPLTVFSGDLLGPSLISTVFEGEQMVTSFNKCNVDVACIGNHDLDFGLDKMNKVLEATMAPNGTCQWVMTNLIQEDRPLDGLKSVGCCLRKAIVTKDGMKIGFIGVCEREWVNLFNDLEVDLIYSNYKRTSAEMAKQLREEDGCDYIIALTHMRVAHDLKFAEEVPGIDLVLGGHDHEYHSKTKEHKPKDSSQQKQPIVDKVVPLVKSGTDFKDFSEIDITFDVSKAEEDILQLEYAKRQQDQTEFQSVLMYSPGDQASFIVNRIRLQDGSWEPESDCQKEEQKYMADFKEKMGMTVGYLGVDLESRDSIIRRSETNFGNLICDLIRTEYSTDFAIVNSGSFRKNDVFKAGPISLLNLQESFPFNDIIVVLKMPGSIFKEALEWAVSKYPAEEGRFPQVSNFQFIFDPEQPEGQRILPRDIITLGGGNFVQSQEYTVAISAFMATGGDGFTMFQDSSVKMVVDDENGLPILDIAKQFFKRTQVDFQVKPRRALARQMRLRLFKVDVEDEVDGVSPDGKFYQLRPSFEGRIRVKGQEVPDDILQRHHTHLNPE